METQKKKKKCYVPEESLQTDTWPGDLASQILQCHFHHVLLVNTVTKFSPGSGGD